MYSHVGGGGSETDTTRPAALRWARNMYVKWPNLVGSCHRRGHLAMLPPAPNREGAAEVR